MKRKHLWGYTAYGPHRIKIWRSYVNPMYDGLTWDRRDGYGVEIYTEVFEQPALLDETLIHEFIHCIENIHGLNWIHQTNSDNASCCQAVRTLGHGLAQMLRELVQL